MNFKKLLLEKRKKRFIEKLHRQDERKKRRESMSLSVDQRSDFPESSKRLPEQSATSSESGETEHTANVNISNRRSSSDSESDASNSRSKESSTSPQSKLTP